MKKTKTQDPINLINLWINDGIDLDGRRIYLSGEIEEESVSKIKRAIMLMIAMDTKKPIHVVVNSFGGSVYDSLGLYDMLQNISCPVYTYAHSKIMSGALIVYLAGSKRYSLPYTTFMAHSVSSGGRDGKTYEQEIDVIESKRLNKIMIQILEDRTNKSKDFWFKKIRTDDFYIDFSEALSYGIVTVDHRRGK